MDLQQGIAHLSPPGDSDIPSGLKVIEKRFFAFAFGVVVVVVFLFNLVLRAHRFRIFVAEAQASIVLSPQMVLRCSPDESHGRETVLDVNQMLCVLLLHAARHDPNQCKQVSPLG